MPSFSEFLHSFNPDSKGKEFESFVKWFLKYDPEWLTQVDQIWLWDDYPDRWGPDCGIDLVFKHKNGDMWAVQAKCYSPEHSITKSDVDKFLSESNRKGIDKRLLIATTDQVGKNAKQVCDAQEKPVVSFLFSDFDKSAIEYPSNLSKLSTAKRKERPVPRPHQIEAIDAVENGFNENDRGQLIMACGTGKTFTTLWIKERISAETALVLVPSLSLLSQTLREWTFACKDPFEVLCVCSDHSVGKRLSDDRIIQSSKDVPFPVTSNVQEIENFLRNNGHKVIFSTYQSSPLIAKSQSALGVPMIDLVICDEAHRCTGKVESGFSTALDDQSIRAKKRLFTTATPRIYSTSVKRIASEKGVDVASMDDEAVFGKPFYTLTFGEAINRNLLTDFQVIIIGVNDLMISEWIERRELVQTASGYIIDASSLASQIGLIKAIKDYDLKRVISFHSRVKNAETFASEIRSSIDFISEKKPTSSSIWTDFVSGQMTSYLRRTKLEQLKELINYDRGLLSNAKCLSEGVDIPSLDGVAFIDPRKSKVDIIQAVGRAIRLSNEKKLGTVVLPVFIKSDENGEASIQASNFKHIWDVLISLKAHDDVFSWQLDHLRTDLGRKKSLSGTDSKLPKIIFDLPTSIDQSFHDSLKTHLVEKTTSSWNFWFGLLNAYIEREGHSRVHGQHKTEDGLNLGVWVQTQRNSYKIKNLSQDQVMKLEKLPKWSWDLLEDEWEELFSHLLQFVEREGHAKVLDSHIIKLEDSTSVPHSRRPEGGDITLGRWVKGLRKLYRENKLSSKKIKRLEALPNWVWDPHADSWEIGFTHIIKFANQNGHARVPDKFKTEDRYGLGRWVTHQRAVQKRLTQDQIKRLEKLPDWSWGGHYGSRSDAKVNSWDDSYSELLKFVEREGHVRVPQKYKTEDGFSLGLWLNAQRMQYKKNLIAPDKIKKLEKLPDWSWGGDHSRWDENYLKLLKFVEREGHARVPQKYKTEDGLKLGLWVLTQRQRHKGKGNGRALTPDQINRLEKTEGWVWEMELGLPKKKLD